MMQIDFSKLSILADDPNEFALACLKRLIEQCNDNGHKMSTIANDSRVLPMVYGPSHFSFCTQCSLSIDTEVVKNWNEAYLTVDGDINECALCNDSNKVERLKIL